MGRIVRSWMILIPAGDMVGRLPRPEADVISSDIEPDVCDVPYEFPIKVETTAVESLCFPVVVQTRPQGAVTRSCPCWAGFPGGGQSGGYSFQTGVHHYRFRCFL